MNSLTLTRPRPRSRPFSLTRSARLLTALALALACVVVSMLVPASAHAKSVVVKHKFGCVAGYSLPRLCVGDYESKHGPIGAVTYRLTYAGRTATLTAGGYYRSREKGPKVAWILGIELVQCTNARGGVKEIYSREVKRVVNVHKGVNRLAMSASVKCPVGSRVTFMETVGLSAYSPNFRPRPAGEVTVEDGGTINMGEPVVIAPNQPKVTAYIIPIDDEFPSVGTQADVEY